MLYVFSTNRVKLVARKPETTVNMGQREYTKARVIGCKTKMITITNNEM